MCHGLMVTRSIFTDNASTDIPSVRNKYINKKKTDIESSVFFFTDNNLDDICEVDYGGSSR